MDTSIYNKRICGRRVIVVSVVTVIKKFLIHTDIHNYFSLYRWRLLKPENVNYARNLRKLNFEGSPSFSIMPLPLLPSLFPPFPLPSLPFPLPPFSHFSHSIVNGLINSLRLLLRRKPSKVKGTIKI